MYTHRQSIISKILGSKIFLIASLIIFVLISFNLIKTIYRRLQIKKEITQIENKVNKLEQSNSDLVLLLDYLKTDNYKEESARKELGLKKPGEQVVVITQEKTTAEQNAPISSQNSQKKGPKIPNPKKWWLYFFK